MTRVADLLSALCDAAVMNEQLAASLAPRLHQTKSNLIALKPIHLKLESNLISNLNSVEQCNQMKLADPLCN